MQGGTEVREAAMTGQEPTAPEQPGPDRQAPDDTGKPVGLVDRAAAAFAAYQAGDRQEMGVLVDMLTPLLWHTARGQGLSGPRAEDAIQTTWLRLVEHADRIDSPRAVVAWLMTTLRRESWRSAKASGREEPAEELEARLPAMAAEPSPEEAAVLRERQVVLWRHLATLGERCQHLLRVIAFADRPDYAQIAEALGMPVGSIGPTRGRCLDRLRRSLGADPEWDGGRG